MHQPHYLVLGCDLSEDGSELGVVTVMRLQYALEFVSECGGVLVLAAGFSPRPWHSEQKDTMAQMMADRLSQRMFSDVVVRQASRFNTRGELEEFLSIEGAAGIISDAHHVERAMKLAYKINPSLALRLQKISVPGGAMTENGSRLEPLKNLYSSLPLWVQDVATFLMHRTLLRHIQLSF